jgi:putative peptide zinc metalloprotease protein
VAIVGWVGSWSMVLGVLAGVAMLGALLVMPVVTFWRRLLRLALPDAQRRRALRAAGALCVGCVVLVGVVPLPFSSVAQGVVWVPEQAQLRTGTDGFLVALEARHGDRVEAGQLLARLEDPRLQADVEKYRHRLAALDADLFQAMLRDPVKLRNVEEEIERVRTQLARALELQAALELRAGVGGQLVMPRQADMEGVFVRRGTLLGHILTRGRACGWPSSRMWRPWCATTPAACRCAWPSCPARAFRRASCGRYRPPPNSQAPRWGICRRAPARRPGRPGPSAYAGAGLRDRPYPGSAAPGARRGRGWVRFDHGWQPLAVQWGRQLKQLFLRHFNPAA